MIQFALKLNWGQKALITRFFDGLKKEIQKELFKEDRLKHLTDYIAIAVKIDNQQYA